MQVDRCPIQGQFDHLERETPLHPARAGEQHLHRLCEPGTGAGRASHHQRRGPARELAVEYQERQAPEMVAVQMGHHHHVDRARVNPLGFSPTRLLAPQSTNSVCPAAAQPDAGLQPPSAPEGVTTAHKLHLHDIIVAQSRWPLLR
jgi:hypothetical protein